MKVQSFYVREELDREILPAGVIPGGRGFGDTRSPQCFRSCNLHNPLTISDPTINNSTRHFAVMSTEARVVSQSIHRVQPLPDLS